MRRMFKLKHHKRNLVIGRKSGWLTLWFIKRGEFMQIQSNLVIRNVLIRNKIVLRNHFPWPNANLLHKDKEHLALRNNFRVTKFECIISHIKILSYLKAGSSCETFSDVIKLLNLDVKLNSNYGTLAPL